jgi:transcriptional regulator with XRE-family HTH domain
LTESPSLRGLELDTELFERIAAGESVRSLARELGVAHTTLARWPRRPEVVSKLRPAQKKRAAERAKERRVERALPRRAREQADRDRLLDARHGPSADRASRNDELAAQAVAAGGGVQDLIEKTGLCTRLGVYESIDPRIVRRALANDRKRAKEQQSAGRLRRFTPDSALISRRAAGEPLRRLAEDCGVSPATLSRAFARPEVAEELRLRQRELSEQRALETRQMLLAIQDAAIWAAHYASKISNIWCPVHHRRTYVTSVSATEGETTLKVAGCCPEAARELIRWLEIYRPRLGTAS